MHFVDRQAKYPNRWTILHSNSSSEVVTLIRNDEPIVEGTPMNAETLNTLSDVAGADIAKEAAEAARDKASQFADSSSISASSAQTSATNAAASASAAKASEDEATRQAELAGTRAGTDKTLRVPDAPADAEKVGDELAVRYTKEQVDALLTQYKADCLLDAHPVGSLFISDDPTSPAELFGGTWEQIKDRFILAAGDTYTAGSMGGEATHVLTQGELPYLRGTVGPHAGENNSLASMWNGVDGVFKNSAKWPGYVKPQTAAFTDATSIKIILFEVGNNQPHNTMPPYIAKYVWQRIE